MITSMSKSTHAPMNSASFSGPGQGREEGVRAGRVGRQGEPVEGRLASEGKVAGRDRGSRTSAPETTAVSEPRMTEASEAGETKEVASRVELWSSAHAGSSSVRQAATPWLGIVGARSVRSA